MSKAAFSRAIPPPGTIPSFKAALVAYIASSTLSFFSFNSTLELAPTRIIPTEPLSIASLCSNLRFINWFFSFFMLFLTDSTLSVRSSPISLVVSTVFLSSVTENLASPSTSGWIRSKSSPNSSLITLAPVKKAKSSIVSSFVGPKPGGFIIFTLILPFTLFIKSADFTCCDTCATISNDLFFFITCSSTLCIFLILGISPETIKISGFSSSHLFLSVFVAKWGDVKPLSSWTPSTMSV